MAQLIWLVKIEPVALIPHRVRGQRGVMHQR